MGVKEFFSKVKEKVRGIAHYDTEGYKNKRKYVLAVASLGILVILVVSFFAGGSLRSRSLTGMVVQQEEEMNQLRADLDSSNQETERLGEELITKSDEVAANGVVVAGLEDELDDKDDEISELNDEVASNSDKVTSLNNQVNDLEGDNKDLEKAVEAYVRSECCSFNDALDGNDKSWDLDGDGIECSGPYTIDCGTGESDFSDDDSEEDEEED